MKTKLLLLALFLSGYCFSQTVENANVYPSNLEDNMYFSSFNQAVNTIEGLNFIVLADGNNSQHVTPAFDVSIYIMPEGSSSREDLIIVKNYPLSGIYHFGKHEFKNESINLNETAGIQPGRYRVGIWVNSNQAFEENTSDNATLFRTPIEVTTASTGSAAKKDDPTTKSDDWDSWDTDDDWGDDDDDDDWDDDDW